MGGWEPRSGCQNATVFVVVFCGIPQKGGEFLRIFVEEQVSDDDEM